MAVLPWVNLPDNRVPDLLGGIGDTLVAAADRKRQEKQRAAEMLMKQREQDRQDQLAQAQIGNYASEAEARKANEARIAAGEKRQQGLDVAGAIPTIKSMLTPGSPNYDPESAMSLARAHGIDLQKVAAPLPPVEEGPRISPDDAQQAGLITSQQQTPSGSPLTQSMPLLRTLDAVQGAGSDQRAIQQAEAERQRFAEANTQKPATRLDTYSGNSPIGPVSIDPNASLEARRFAQERTRSELAPLVQAVPPQYRATIQAMIQSGNYDAKSIQAAITEAQKEAAKDSENSTYKEPETERERHNRAMEAAAMANAHARATSAGEGANPALIAELGDQAQAGATQNQLLRAAAAGGATKPMKVATTLMKDPEKEAALQVRDLAGNVVGNASSTREKDALEKRIVAAEAARRAAQEYADHIQAHGRIWLPVGEDARERARLHTQLVARLRDAQQLGVSNAQIGLEQAGIGSEGIGPNIFHQMSSPEAIRRAGEEQATKASQDVRARVRPGERVGQGTDNPLTRAARAKSGTSETPEQRTERLAKILGVSQ